MKRETNKAGQPTSIIPANARINKPAMPIDGKPLAAALYQNRKADPKEWRQPDEYRMIPESVYFDVSGLGRAKYRSIVVVTIMALLWNGWKSRKKIRSRRIGSNDVMITRRMLAVNFGMPEATAGRALDDLESCGLITVSKKAVYSGKSGQNLGTCYRLAWMEEKSSTKHIRIRWGLLVSGAFLSLSVTAQAIIILLHCLPKRSKNRITIQPYALSRYGIHRTTMRRYLQELMNAGLLVFTDEYDFAFAWLDADGEPDFRRFNKNFHVAN